MKEDALERIAREEQSNNKSTKTALWIFIIIAVILAIVLGYTYYKNQQLVNQLNEEKVELTEQLSSLQADFSELNTENEKITSQLDSSREEVAQLIQKVKKTKADNRRMMRKYQKELGTLRSIMKNYIVQIDSLNSQNKKLKKDVATARKEAEVSRQKNEELNKQVEDLSGKIAVGSMLKARGLKVTPYNRRNKTTSRCRRVKKLMTSITLLENDLANKGPVVVYVRVKDPQGILLTNNERSSFEFNGETLVASAAREVDYQGKELDLSIYLNDIPKYSKGIYNIEVYIDNQLLGATELMLR